MIDVKLLSGALGAEISGIDLTDVSDENFRKINNLLLEHKVIFFRDQDMTPEEQITFVSRFGEPDIYPFVRGLDNYPQITPVLKLPDETVNFGGIWHSDTVYMDKPPMGTILYAKELPPMGGDTLFANTAAAYAALPTDLKGRLDGRRTTHSYEAKHARRAQEGKSNRKPITQAKRDS